MTPELKIALIRGLISAALVGGVTFFSLAANTKDTWTLLIGAGGAAFSVLASRFGAEGFYDSSMAKAGKTAPATEELPVEIHPH